MLNYLLIFIVINCCAGIAGAGEFDPWNFSRPVVKVVSGPAKNLSLPAYLLYQGSAVFSRYISPVDGDRCAMYPTCSSYSRQAVARHGFFIGYVMTVDRLLHENNEVDTAKESDMGGYLRYDDPVENNDFWWYKYP